MLNQVDPMVMQRYLENNVGTASGAVSKHTLLLENAYGIFTKSV